MQQKQNFANYQGNSQKQDFSKYLHSQIQRTPELQLNQNEPFTNSYRNLFVNQSLQVNNNGIKHTESESYASKTTSKMQSLSSYISKSPQLARVEAKRRAEDSRTDLTTIKGDHQNKYLQREPQKYNMISPSMVQNAIKNCIKNNQIYGPVDQQVQVSEATSRYFAQEFQNIKSQNDNSLINHEDLDFEITSKAATQIFQPLQVDQLFDGPVSVSQN